MGRSPLILPVYLAELMHHRKVTIDKPGIDAKPLSPAPYTRAMDAEVVRNGVCRFSSERFQQIGAYNHTPARPFNTTLRPGNLSISPANHLD
jgi:hypothetical protein